MAVFKRKRRQPNGSIKEYPHYWYKFMRNGVPVVVDTKQSNKDAAKALEREHQTRLAKGEAGLIDGGSIPSFKNFFEGRFMDSIKVRSPKTAIDDALKAKSLLAFDHIANRRLDRVDEPLIERWIQKRIKKVCPGTVNRGLSILKKTLRQAREWKLINHVPRIKHLPGERQREFVLSDSQEVAYIEACSQPLKDVAILILSTGLRSGEALVLEWKDVDLEAARLSVRKGKSKNAKRTLTLLPKAVEMLKARKKDAVDRFVFSNGFGKPYLVSSLSKMQASVRLALKWPDSDDLCLHALRHTFLTRMGELGVDAFTLMRIAGHSTVMVSQRYVHPSSAAMEAAFKRLDEGRCPVGTQPSIEASDRGLRMTANA